MNTNTRHWASITAGIFSLAGYAAAANLGSEKYTYDASGNITEKSIDGKVTKLAYERSNRLTDLQADGQNKEIISRDPAGRPVSEAAENGKQIRKMSYGYGDKVLEVQNHGIKADLYYNADGQLVGKDIYGTFSAYIWDGNVLAAKGSEAFTNEAHATGGVPVLAEGGESAVVSDYLGTTLASGNMQCSSTAYGEGLEEGRFTGKPFVKELGCFVFQFRNYSPTTLKWTSQDPLGFPDGPNCYSIVNGDPVSKIDVYGLMTVDPNPLGPVPGITNYSKPINEVNYTYKVTFTAFEGTCADGTKAILWKSPVVVDPTQPAPPAAQFPAVPAAVKIEIAKYYKKNCHGYTLGVDAWINPGGAGYGSNTIEAIIKGEGYKVTKDQNNQAKIVTYGSISHSAIVSEYAGGKVTKVTHKDNDITIDEAGPIDKVLATYGNVAKYWEK